MKKENLVGVFIPAYNAAHFIEKAIQSVLDQTFQDFELLILDDASTDNTQAVIKPYLSHPRVTYVRNERNLGMSPNWNKGISLLQNKYIAKLDADDFYHPNFLRHTVDVLDHNPTVGLVFSGLNWITLNGSYEMRPYTSPWIADGQQFRSNLLRRFVTQSATICVRNECYHRLGGFVEQMRIHSDWEMWTRIASHYEVAYIDKSLASMVRHKNSCTTNSKYDTRSPDDFNLWLNLLDTGALPYHFDEADRRVLEAAMIRKIKKLLENSVRAGNEITAKACVVFMLQRRLVPPYEKARYRLLLALLNRYPNRATISLRGSRWTNKLWSLDKWLSIKIPARDPYDALAGTMKTGRAIGSKTSRGRNE